MQKRMNYFLIVSILSVILSISFILAPHAVTSDPHCSVVDRTSCVDAGEHIVMGLSGTTNAHGELASESNYDKVLCCNFGSGDVSCTNTANVDGVPDNTRILRLSSSTNAHAEIPTGSTYPIEVCYEDFECMNLDTTGSDCTTATSGIYQFDVLSLTGATNAHIGGPTAYPSQTICCRSAAKGSPCDLTNAYWEVPGVIIGDGNPVMAGTQANLILEGDFCLGASITFEILEDGEVKDAFAGNFDTVNSWATVWFDDSGVLDDPDPEYHFRATATGSEDVVASMTNAPNLLEVSQVDPLYCQDKTICSDYPEQSECESDATLCMLAESSAPPAVNCNDPLISCECAWTGNVDTGSCGFVAKNIGGFCGNGAIDASEGEECDGTNWGPITSCTGLDAFTGGDLSCNPPGSENECKFNTNLCLGGVGGECGNGVVNTGETCDGSAWGPISGCSDLGFTGGALNCFADGTPSECSFDTSQCTGNPGGGLCGDSIIQQPNAAGYYEQCDPNAGTDVFLPGENQCPNPPFSGGALGCTGSCAFDYNSCTGGPTPTCGDNIVNQLGETCDGTDLGGYSCQVLGYSGGTLGCSTGSCQLDVSGCITPPPGTEYCGDAIAQVPNDAGFREECDVNDLGTANSCDDLSSIYESSGTLGCKSSCTYDLTQCVVKAGSSISCGDGVVNQVSEECDYNIASPSNPDLDGRTCQTLGFGEGTLQCDNSCDLDTTACSGELISSNPISAGTCEYTESTNDDCDDGFLTYSWTVEWTSESGESQPSSCVDGSRVVECPAQIQLPFFSLFNIAITLALISLIYAFMILRKKK